MKHVRKNYSEFWAELMHIRLKAAVMAPTNPMDVYRRETDFLVETLSLKPGSRVLELGCGAGEYCLLLAEQGVHATGIDIAPVLIDHARRQAVKADTPAEFACADMRQYRCDTPYDAVFTSSGTFGLFDHSGNRAVLDTIRAVLAEYGRFLIGPSGPALLETDSWSRRDWSVTDEGCLLTEQRWDRDASLLHNVMVFVDDTGTVIEQEVEGEETWWGTTRPYSVDELDRMVSESGLVTEAMYGSYALPPKVYCSDDARLLMVGRKALPNTG